MSLIDFFKKPINVLPGPKKDAQLVSDLGNPAAWLLDIFNGRTTVSGENSSHETAMMLDSYFAAIRNIAEDIAKLPFNIFEIVPNGKKLVTTHPNQQLIHRFANKDMSMMDLMQTIIHWAISFGNGYAEIVRNQRGRAVEMWPIHPSRVKPFYNENGVLFYDVHSNITIQGQEMTFVRIPAENIFNLRGLGADGIVGYSLFALAAESVGQGLAVQKFASAYFRNGAALTGILTSPNSLDKKAYQNMRESWDKIHAEKAENKHKIAILEAGTTFVPTASTAAESQLLESQKFTVIRMARLIRIPAHKIGSTELMGKGNLEAQEISYFRDTLMPWIRRISLETDRKIIRSERFTAHHEVNALTLGDSKTRAGVFKTHRNMGTMSINDVLRLENMNAIEEDWADEHHMQLNITTVENISDGANLKAKGAGQMGTPTLEPGENSSEARAIDPLKAEKNIDIKTTFLEAKQAHIPNFRYAAGRIVNKELNFLTKKLKSLKEDYERFDKLVEHFFQTQKVEIIDTFGPCCEVFINTFAIEGIELKMDFLEDFADNYATDGIAAALKAWKDQSQGEIFGENLAEQREKMANAVINNIAMSAKGNKDDS